MKVSNTGQIIRECREKAGFTQKTLAAALHITDKAISKWERGICLPDVALLPKLSLLLDTDMEVFLSSSIEQEQWAGVIDIRDCDFAQPVYDKPLAYYLLSHYLLLGITRVHVLTNEQNRSFLQDGVFRSFGFDLRFDLPGEERLMIINHPWFLFGSDLTQQFQGAMLSGRNTKLVPMNQEPVVFFAQDSHLYFSDPKRFVKTAAVRTLGRGMVCLDIDDRDKVLETASFVKTYQQNAGLLIASLEEIAFRKGLVSYEKLEELAAQTAYRKVLLDTCKPKVD